MSQNRSKPNSRRRRSKKKKPAVDVWRPVPQLDDPEPIRAPEAPATLLRSLGDPPLKGQGSVAEHYLAAVAEKASGMAVALAATADLLADEDGDDGEGTDGAGRTRAGDGGVTHDG